MTLVGSFMVLTGIILHSIARIMQECKSEMMTIGRASHEHHYSAGTRPEIINTAPVIRECVIKTS